MVAGQEDQAGMERGLASPGTPGFNSVPIRRQIITDVNVLQRFQKRIGVAEPLCICQITL